MPRMTLVLIIAILSLAGAAPGAEKKDPAVDARWLERALHYDYESDAGPLVKEFAQAHPSEALSADAKLDDGAYLNIMTANLDEDPEPEHLLFIGPDSAHTMLYVISRRGGQWKIIFGEYVDLFNEDPELYIINQHSRNKLFYIRTLYERGSGVWLFTWRFYRIVRGTVYNVLEIVQDSNLALEASNLYQHADTIVRGSSDGVFVTYRYRFAPSMQLLISLGLAKDYSNERKVDLIDDEENVLYTWNEASRKLVPSLEDSKLSEAKIQCFSKLGDEYLFAKAFEKELREIAKSGTADQKKVAEYLLKKKPKSKSRNK